MPDGVPHIRPQPRKPHFLRAPAARPLYAPPSKSPALEAAAHIDAVPREPVPRPPSPPVLYSSRRDISFTFLPSTCSEESATVQKSHLLTQHGDVPQQPPQSSTHQSSLVPPVVQRPAGTRTSGTTTLAPRHTHTHLETHHPHPHSLLPPSAFEKPRTGSCGNVAVHKPPVTSGHGTMETDPGIPLGLTNPTVQTEIVHMRDELKQYHDLKVRQRCNIPSSLYVMNNPVAYSIDISSVYWQL